MTATGDERHDDHGDDDDGSGVPYTDTSQARLVMAYEAYELAELARAAVPVGEHELRPDGTTGAPGSVLADADRILTAAHRFLEAAVVYERLGGADWRLIGALLNLPPQTARDRFATAADRAAGEARWWQTHVVRHPRDAALDLDDWVLRHEDGEGADLGTAPVSGGLVHGNHRRRDGDSP